MPYTLIKFLLWFGLAAVIGVGIGWLLRSLKARTEIAARPSVGVETEEVTRLRQRLVNMEEVVEERDRLRIKVAELRRNDEPGVVTPAPAPAPAPAPPPSLRTESTSGFASGGDPESGSLADAEPEIEPDVVTGVAAQDAESPAETPSDAVDAADVDVLDSDTASVVLGRDVTIDDLTVVEGIGPKISELCRGINIETWRQLADADLDELRSMLDAAGPRYQLHDPSTWPHQAELLATGRWDSFKRFTDDLRGES